MMEVIEVGKPFILTPLKNVRYAFGELPYTTLEAIVAHQDLVLVSTAGDRFKVNIGVFASVTHYGHMREALEAEDSPAVSTELDTDSLKMVVDFMNTGFVSLSQRGCATTVPVHAKRSTTFWQG